MKQFFEEYKMKLLVTIAIALSIGVFTYLKDMWTGLTAAPDQVKWLIEQHKKDSIQNLQRDTTLKRHEQSIHGILNRY